MTKVVRGAGRAKAASRARHNNQESRVVGGKRDDALKRAAEKKAPAKAAAKKSSTSADGPAWNPEKSLGANVDHLKNKGVTWRLIAEVANENGHEIPWPDGGKLLRARKAFLNGTEGQPRAARSPRRKTTATNPDGSANTVEERIAQAMSMRSVPWDTENTEEEIIEMVSGRRITFVSKLTGQESSARVPKESKHTRIAEGADGPYITFAAMEGPFMNISLSRIVSVS